MKTLALALTVSTGALWAQAQTTPPANPPQPSPVADEPTQSTAAEPTDPAPPVSANPANQESDALPQSGVTQSTETPPPPVTEEPLPATAAPVESPKPAEPAPQPKLENVSGTVVSSSASALVIETMSGAKLTFVIDSATTEPELHAKDAVSVEYTTAADGTRHANRVTIQTPKKSAAVASPRQTAPPAPKKPAVAPAAPLQSVAVTPPAPVPEPTPAPPIVNEPAAPAAEPLASGASTDSAENHTLSSDTQALNPLATSKVASESSPVRMVVPVVILLGGLLFITVLGVRQARREA
jgi:nicotinate-nucleotide--dimethylbenzimidazole phosphoribosyltransferase